MKLLKTILIDILLLSVILTFYLKIDLSLQYARSILDLWYLNIVPIFLSSLLLVNLMIELNVFDHIAFICNYLFKINGYILIVILISVFIGFPSNTILINKLYENNKLSYDNSLNLIYFQHYGSIGLILGTIGIGMFKSLTIGKYLFISNFLSSLILILLNINLFSKQIVSFDKPDFNLNIFIEKNIKKIALSLLYILGYLTFFMTIASLLRIILNKQLFYFVLGFIEFSSGCLEITTSSFYLPLKIAIASLFLSFGSLSCHLQTMSFSNLIKISYSKYLYYRLLQGFISFILTLGLLYFF